MERSLVAQGYDDTLCSLSVLRTDYPHVPTERRRRPHAEAFAEHPLTDGSKLIQRSALLDALEDDDDMIIPIVRTLNRQISYLS